MKRLLALVGIGLLSMACGSSSTSTTAPTPTPAPTPTQPAATFTLTGVVTIGTSTTAISNATVTVQDSANAGKSATTDANGRYTISGLIAAGMTVAVAAPGYGGSSKGVTVTAATTLNFTMLPNVLFAQSGIGDNVFTIPSYVTRVRVDASYSGSCQNFIVRISTSLTSLINVIIGTCSVADTRSPFSGTYAINNGGQVTITSSTGINWTFTEAR